MTIGVSRDQEIAQGVVNSLLSAAECIMTAARAINSGHAVESRQALEPVTWAKALIDGALATAAGELGGMDELRNVVREVSL